MNTTTLSFVAVCIFAAIVGTASYAIHSTTKDTVVATVVDKERITTGTGQNTVSKYLIFTDNETFENTDTIWALKWNSSDIYGRIERNATCRFEVVGFRVPFLSMYRNILSADCD